MEGRFERLEQRMRPRCRGRHHQDGDLRPSSGFLEKARGGYPRGVLGASAYCFDAVAESCNGLLAFCCSVARCLRGYSYYDNGRRFTIDIESERNGQHG